MITTQKHLITYLKAAIHNRKLSASSLSTSALNQLFLEAKDHSIQGLIYSAISDISSLQDISPDIINTWKKETFLTGMTQNNHITQMSKVFLKFNQESIPVIALKGLTLRDLYPKPDLRSMSDADILINLQDVDKSCSLLSTLGYIEVDHNPCHIVFSHPYHLSIELHWTLANSDYSRDISCFESHIWDNAIPFEIGLAQILVLSLEDQLIYLCIHMAAHLTYCGFGIRQLCDFYLFLNNYANKLDWHKVNTMCQQLYFKEFMSALFLVCHKYFQLELPSAFMYSNKINTKYADALLEDILASGTFGRKTFHRALSVELSHLNKDNPSSKLLDILFPPISTLLLKYSYLKKCILFLPVAWLHHLLHLAFRKDCSSYDKLKALFLSKHNFKKRSYLLNKINF